MVLYAIHDALVKPMPGGLNTPSLAESWTASKDGLTYEFVLRKGVKFHNGDPVTAEDVKFSFERYRGGGAKILKERVKEVQVVDARPGALRPEGAVAGLHDLLRHDRHRARGGSCRRSTSRRWATTASRRRPIGAGPYKFVSFKPGHRAGARGLRRLLAQGAEREAPGAAQHAGRDHARRRAEARRGGHRLLPERARSPRTCGARPG